MIGPWLQNSFDVLEAEVLSLRTERDAANARVLQLAAECAFMASTDTADTERAARQALVARAEAAEAARDALQAELDTLKGSR